MDPLTMFFQKQGYEPGEVLHDAQVGGMENSRMGIGVYRHYETGILHSSDMLMGAGNAAGDVEPGRYGLSGDTDLTGVGEPAPVAYSTGAAD